MSRQEQRDLSPELPLELFGLFVQAQDFANGAGKPLQVMLTDFKYGNTQSFEVTANQEVGAQSGQLYRRISEAG